MVKTGYNINTVAQLKVMVAWIQILEKNIKRHLGVKLVICEMTWVLGVKGSVRHDATLPG